MSEQTTNYDQVALLNSALAEAQTTVRAYDTKAQIVGVGYAFALGIVDGTKDWLPSAGGGSILSVLVFWLVVMAPLVLFGFVLYPSRKTAPRVDASSETVKHILYVDVDNYRTLTELNKAAEQCEPISEITYELLKVSKLRELKRKRFVRALLAAAFSFSVLFLAQMSTVFP